MAQPEPAYTAGEAAKLARLLARGGWQAQRGKSTAAVDRQIDELKESARRRIDLEAQARQAAADKRDRERAARRAERRFW